MEENEIPDTRKQLDDVRKLVASATAEQKEKAAAIEAQLVTMLDEHKHRLLEWGAADRLLVSGELEDVLALEDDEALEKAKPISLNGGVKLDPQKIELRHAAQGKAVMKGGAVAVIILGGAHDLTGSIKRIGDGRVEYLPVTTKRFRQIGQ
jgi:hypothetical protein